MSYKENKIHKVCVGMLQTCTCLCMFVPLKISAFVVLHALMMNAFYYDTHENENTVFSR